MRRRTCVFAEDSDQAPPSAEAKHAFNAPSLPRTELQQYREPDGRIPVIGTDNDARADAFVRVPAFLEEKLGKL